MIAAWVIWILVILGTFAVLEGFALRTGRITLSRTIRNAYERWPFLGVIFGFVSGGLLVHFFWRFCLVVFALLFAGCSSLYGPTGDYSGTLTCKGKGSLTGNGSLSIGAGYGGSGTNAWTIQGDCGEGFSIQRSRERASETPDRIAPQ